MRIAQHHLRLTRRDGLSSDVAVVAFGRWVRVGLFAGTAPGSRMIGRHWVVWPTRLGEFHGWNVRFGWWPKPCVTVLLHTRPARPP